MGRRTKQNLFGNGKGYRSNLIDGVALVCAPIFARLAFCNFSRDCFSNLFTLRFTVSLFCTIILLHQDFDVLASERPSLKITPGTEQSGYNKITELVIIGSEVSQWENLAEPLPHRLIHRLNENSKDPLRDLANLVGKFEGLKAIHLISHGRKGFLEIGGKQYSAAGLQGLYQNELETIGNALKESGDLLLYGCDIASGVDGRTLASTLSKLTKADIAASIDTTGHTGLNGDWILEHTTGPIETRLAIGPSAQLNWRNELATSLVNWATRPTTNFLTGGTDNVTVDTITMTSSGGQTGTASSRTNAILPTTTYDGFSGVLASAMDGATDNGSVTHSMNFTFSEPVYNLTFTIVDIDGGTGQVFNDGIQLNSDNGFPTATSGSNVSYNPATGFASALGTYCSAGAGNVANCLLTPTFAGPINSASVVHSSHNAAGTNPQYQVIVIDDFRFNTAPDATNNTNSVNSNATVAGNVVTDNDGSGTDSDLQDGASVLVNQISHTDGTSAVGGGGATLNLANGASLTIAQNGAYTFNPNAAYQSLPHGTVSVETFTYRIEDQEGLFNENGDTPRPDSLATLTITITTVHVADLELVKTVNDASPPSETNITYTLTLTNNGPNDALGVQVTDLLPAALTFVSSTPSQGSYNDGTGLWDLGTVLNGATPTLDIVATVTGSSTITNIGEVTASTYGDPDSTPGDGSGDDYATVSVTPVVNPGPVGSLRCVGTDLVTNGGFETPSFAAPPGSNMTPPASVPGWSTTDTAIEIWEGGFLNVPSHTGTQFAELNANVAGVLSNNSAAVQNRSELVVYWAHRGRGGTDTASLAITDNGGNTTNPPNFSTGNTLWSTYSSTHVTGATATTATLSFTAVSTGSGSISVGNFLDSVEVCQTYITLGKTGTGTVDVDTSGSVTPGDTVSYQFTITNPTGNEKSVSAIQIIDDQIGTFGAVPVSGDNGNNILDPGETWVINASYTITQADVDAAQVINIAYAQGSTGTNTIRTDDETETFALPPAPSLLVTKVADAVTNVTVGQVITYTYTITNNGNQTLTNISMADLHGGSGPAPAPDPDGATLTDNGPAGDSTNPSTGDGVWDILAPGDVLTATATYSVTQNDVDSLQ